MTNSDKNQSMINVEIIGRGEYTVAQGTRINQLIAMHLSNCEFPILAVMVQNSMHDLNYILHDADKIELIDLTSEKGARIYRRSAMFILIKACRELFPDRTVIVRHSMSNGIFCEFRHQEVTPAEVKMIEEQMHKMDCFYL